MANKSGLIVIARTAGHWPLRQKPLGWARGPARTAARLTRSPVPTEWLVMARYVPPDYLPGAVLERPDFQAACADRDLGRVLAIASKWSGPGFTVSHIARRCEMTISQVQAYIKGIRQAQSIDIFERAADGLHIPGHMLGMSKRLWESQPGTAELDADHGESQQVPAGAGAILSGQPALWVPRQDAESLQPADDAAIILMIQQADRTDIGPGTIEGLYAIFDKLCRDYPSADTRDLRRGLKRLYTSIMQLRQGRITFAQHRELIALAGWVTALLACVEWDMNQREAAETARSATARFAKEIGHAELTAWSYEIQAWFSLTEGRYSDVTSIAKAGQEIGGENSAIVQLIMQEARGWSRLGNRRAAESAIDRGYSMLQKLPAINYPRHFIFDRTKFPFYAASCHQWFGDYAQAEELANQVIRECEANGTTERSPMRLAEVHITLGLIHAARSDPEAAVSHGTQALTYQRKSGPTLLTQASELNRAIKERFPRSRQAIEYEDTLEAFCREFGLHR